jgi:hypothetical protein
MIFKKTKAENKIRDYILAVLKDNWKVVVVGLGIAIVLKIFKYI